MSALLAEWKKIAREIHPSIPGLILVLIVAIVARFLQSLIPGPMLNKAISEILIAVLIGLLVRNVFGLFANTQAGITFSLHRLLRLGIILLGLRLSLQDVIATGLSSLILIIACITLALTLAFAAGRCIQNPSSIGDTHRRWHGNLRQLGNCGYGTDHRSKRRRSGFCRGDDYALWIGRGYSLSNYWTGIASQRSRIWIMVRHGSE